MEEEQGGATVDSIVNEFETYESFLDSQISSLDLYYLEDEELARQLVELGYRGSGEVLKREEFEMRKAAAEAARLAKKSQKKRIDVTHLPSKVKPCLAKTKTKERIWMW